MYYGFNGENWFDAADYTSNQWIIDAVKEEFTLRFRADKDDFNPAHIEKLIQLHQQFLMVGKSLKVIYCANIKIDPNIPFSNIIRLKDAGVDIIAVEYGNETYSKEQANFNFETYKTWFEPLKNLVDTMYMFIDHLIFLAPRPKESGVLGGRNDHSAFNNAAINYIVNHDRCYPTVHIYLNERECPIRSTEIAKRVYTGAPDAELESYYEALYSQAMTEYLNLWDKTLSYIFNSTGKGVYITEWGFDNYGGIKNTIIPGMIAMRIWTSYYNNNKIVALLQHNGLSMASPGAIFPAHPDFDFADPNSTNLRRVDYWIFKMFMEAKDKLRLYNELPQVGDNYYLIASDSALPAVTTPEGLTSVDFSLSYIGGDKPYTSAGATAWMKKGSIRSNELQVLENVSVINNYPFYIGFIKETYDIVTPINEPPVADAGDDIIVYLGEPFILDGSASYDPDGTITSYTWYDSDGAIVSNTATFSSTLRVEGTYAYYLEITDNQGDKTAAVVYVEVIKKPCTKPWWCIFVPRNKKCNC